MGFGIGVTGCYGMLEERNDTTYHFCFTTVYNQPTQTNAKQRNLVAGCASKPSPTVKIMAPAIRFQWLRALTIAVAKQSKGA